MMKTTIQLYLLENKSIQAKVNGYPYTYEGGYNIVAGDKNVTEFEIASIPPQYMGWSISLEMTNALKKTVEPPDIVNGKFGLPIGMAVAGYGQIIIKAVSGDSEAVFLPLKIKIANTDANWQSGVINIVPLEFGDVEMLPSDSEPYAKNVGTDAKPIIDLGIPSAAAGKAATIRIGDVSTLPPGSNAIVQNVGTSVDAVISFGIPEGKGFKISRSYSSIDEMNAFYPDDNVPPYGFVIIETGNVDDEDNSKLFMKSDSGYVFLTDMSGMQGIQGEVALVYNGIVKSSLPPSSNVGGAVIEHIRAEDFNRPPHEGDVFLVLYAYMRSVMSDSSDDILAEYMMQLKIIRSSLDNELTAVLNNKLIMPVRGATGAQGERGQTGVGIKKIIYEGKNTNGDYLYDVLMTDGSKQSFTAPKVEFPGKDEFLEELKSSFVQKKGDTMTGPLTLPSIISANKTGADAIEIIPLPKVPFELIDPTHTTVTYLKNLLKWICTNYPNKQFCVFIGVASPNSAGEVIIHIYDTSVTNSDGFPQYASGLYQSIGGDVTEFGTNNYAWYYRAMLTTEVENITAPTIQVNNAFLLGAYTGSNSQGRIERNDNTKSLDILAPNPTTGAYEVNAKNRGGAYAVFRAKEVYEGTNRVYSPNKPNTQLIYNSNTSITIPADASRLIYGYTPFKDGDIVHISGYLGNTSALANTVNIMFPINLDSVQKIQYMGIPYKTPGGYTSRFEIILGGENNETLEVSTVKEYLPDNTALDVPMTITHLSVRRFAQ